MIVGSLEEMVESNQRKFQKMLESKHKILADNLKYTLKDLFEDIRNLNFSANEVMLFLFLT